MNWKIFSEHKRCPNCESFNWRDVGETMRCAGKKGKYKCSFIIDKRKFYQMTKSAKTEITIKKGRVKELLPSIEKLSTIDTK